MTNLHPPCWAESVLRLLLRPADRETIPGDLLEEYRAAKIPQLGRVRANLWYVTQVAGFLMPLVWPFTVGVVVVTLAGFSLQGGPRVGYGSPLPAPGISLIHALFYLCAAFYGSHRTGLVTTGMLSAGVTGMASVTAFFVTTAATMPGLVMAPFENPFIFVILSIYVLIAVGYSVLMGAVAGLGGRLGMPPAVPGLRASN